MLSQNVNKGTVSFFLDNTGGNVQPIFVAHTLVYVLIQKLI